MCKYVPEVMEKDMLDLGYLMEYQLLDASSFLVRQRRNRVWATLDINNGQDCQEFRAGMKRSVGAMASKFLFPEEVCFRNLPQTKRFNNATEKSNVEHAHAVAVKMGDENIFADVTKSASRRETPMASQLASDQHTQSTVSRGKGC